MSNTHGTDDIFKAYTSGEKTMEETNEALRESDANFHLEPLTDEERQAKREREDTVGYFESETPRIPVPKQPDMSRRLDMIGKPKEEREVVQHTVRGDYRIVYDEQGYAVRATRL